MIEITRGNPPVEAIPYDEILLACTEVLATYKNSLNKYGSSMGFLQLREFLSTKFNVPIEQIIIGNGGMNIFSMLITLLLRENKNVYVELPTYDFALDVFHSQKAKIRGIEVEKDGIDVIRLEKYLVQVTPSMLYVIPDFQNPTGATISLEKRLKLVELAYKYNFWIVEDAAYRSLRYRGANLPSLYELCPERVLHIGSFSKTITPSLRVGYLVGNQEIVKNIAEIARLNYIFPNNLSQAIVYELIKSNKYQIHLENIRRQYSECLQVLLSTLSTNTIEKISWFDVEGGFFVGLFCDFEVSTYKFLELTYRQNISLLSGDNFFSNFHKGIFVRICFPNMVKPDIEKFVNSMKTISTTL